jgi:hypothetical protein
MKARRRGGKEERSSKGEEMEAAKANGEGAKAGGRIRKDGREKARREGKGRRGWANCKRRIRRNRSWRRWNGGGGFPQFMTFSGGGSTRGKLPNPPRSWRTGADHKQSFKIRGTNTTSQFLRKKNLKF